MKICFVDNTNFDPPTSMVNKYINNMVEDLKTKSSEAKTMDDAQLREIYKDKLITNTSEEKKYVATPQREWLKNNNFDENPCRVFKENAKKC